MKSRIFILTTAVTLFVVGCKKDQAATPEETQQTVVGYYTGKRNFDPASNDYTHNYAMLLNANGTARVYNLGNGSDTAALLSIAKMDGSWIQNGSSLVVNYKPIGSPITASASVNKQATDINGTWAFDGATKGKFYLGKK